jgi:hypothetical protein
MVIVSLTRGDLRDEFSMADEAFALSPISARAALPSEEDYDAIREAFMETSRGRWFLGEYAKRNRNADTGMVLDAVARIEEALAAQKQPAPDNSLAETLAAIRLAVNEAKSAASSGFDKEALEQDLARIRKGSRIVREISWRWREIGADGRICDLLDSQVGAIDDGCDRITAIDPLTALNAAFDLVDGQIKAFDKNDAPSSPADAKADSPQAATEAEAAADIAPEPAVVAEAIQPAAVEANGTVEDDEPYDDALLDAIALEMAAPDPSDAEEVEDSDHRSAIDAAVSTQLGEPKTLAQPEPASFDNPAHQAMPEPAPSPVPLPESAPEPSLGSTLLASGIVRKPSASKADPLAPIRRMSQAEKIALFS